MGRRTRALRADREMTAQAAAQIARVDKIIEAIRAMPDGPMLTPAEHQDKLIREALARIGAVPRDEEARPRFAANGHEPPPWKNKETTP